MHASFSYSMARKFAISLHLLDFRKLHLLSRTTNGKSAIRSLDRMPFMLSSGPWSAIHNRCCRLTWPQVVIWSTSVPFRHTFSVASVTTVTDSCWILTSVRPSACSAQPCKFCACPFSLLKALLSWLLAREWQSYRTVFSAQPQSRHGLKFRRPNQDNWAALTTVYLCQLWIQTRYLIGKNT